MIAYDIIYMRVNCHNLRSAVIDLLIDSGGKFSDWASAADWAYGMGLINEREASLMSTDWWA